MLCNGSIPQHVSRDNGCRQFCCEHPHSFSQMPRNFCTETLYLISVVDLVSVQAGSLVKGEAKKSPLLWRFSGGSLVFSAARVLWEFEYRTLVAY